jgi:hypothetical protein
MSVNVQRKSMAPPQACVIRPKYRRFVIRPIFDAAAAAAVFAMFTFFTTCEPVRASTNPAAFAGLERAAPPVAIKAVGEAGPPPIIEIATTSSTTNADAVYRRTSATAAWVLLGLAFSLLAALNLTVFRHLRRAYVAPKRRSGRPQ